MTIITAIVHTILYVYPSYLFTKWSRNDTTETRIGFAKGLYFQLLVNCVIFGAMFLVVLFNRDIFFAMGNLQGLFGSLIAVIWTNYLLKVATRFAGMKAPSA